MPSSVCKLHLSHIRRAVVYPPRRRISAVRVSRRAYRSTTTLQIRRESGSPPRSAPPAARSPPRSAFCSRLFVRIFSRPFAVVRRLFCFLFDRSNLFFRIVRRGRRAGWNPHIFYFWPFFQRLRKSAMNTRAVTQENACARAREIFAPRFPKNFPKNFRVSFSRFVFAVRFFSESEFTL